MFTFKKLAGVAAIAAAGLILSACSGPSADNSKSSSGSSPSAAAPSTGGPLKVAVVTHGSAGDAFWNVVKNGAEQASKDLNVGVDYFSDGDPGNQARLIDNAVAQKVGGLVVSMANPQALQTSIQNAVKAGIPVVTINSGEDFSAQFGAIAHVGQSEGLAGQGAGQRLKAAGKTKLLCVIHEAGNIGQNQRCDGAKQTFGNVTTLQVDISNPTDAQARIRGALQSDPSIDAVLALNSQVAARAVAAAKEASSKAQVATFDLNADVVAAIKDGSILFAVDQQQYEQGYLPIVFLKLYKENGNTIGGGKPVQTGPGFVDKTNIDTIAPYAQRGTR
ncbi:sugar ABC transporter periplasmic protein [Amycolatopsis mediterranei S699]|uniref:Periplasmic substrate-binding component of ABC-type sugar transport system n=2 Tax=Amycolatopsis mediterranei TaxID=33910 RepID=A0A0H3CYG8_AMYMU|nr:sugar ABC transporter substrate-binding protein [Amycolatopsis mediterranei]ADJ43697.1 periplasmic substrate-binding component of ABC-type sugar transport system [Amycolatopsis mediterranei U32]AEK40405.1 sugar ABC transporter periplasmic protein [Amycolatopsis mediterranei S699]AFO75409.1 sugar ABC transporter periplasmic protein [Amycolatopsis mediterranei S699]AGT82538.1 sugar ABC transporter periplasmic protein [Amycolatopsis mediterranei RB]KDO10211.1 sugar ABC transporter substrate-bi